MHRIFIDGSAGTTGLRIRQRLAERDDLSVTVLPEELRKDESARKAALNDADAVFLCLPDAAAKEAAAWVENPHTVVLDTSTVHRTAPGWAYGFAELGGEWKANLQSSKRIAVPGCHASGVNALLYPLRKAGLLDAGALLAATSLTGYTGGGKSMIADYKAADKAPDLYSPRAYALGQQHKHLPEICAVCGLEHAPVFVPVVDDYACGMLVTIPLHAGQLAKPAGPDEIRATYAAHYAQGGLVQVQTQPADGFWAAGSLAGKDCMQIAVGGTADRMLLMARFDNLGKGASGAAIQCMNLALGLPETAGLVIE